MAEAAARLEPLVRIVGTVLLAATVAIVVTNLWEVTVTAGAKVLVAIAIVTIASLATGHFLGGADPSVRTALAFSCAARNPGLALLVATSNGAPPQVNHHPPTSWCPCDHRPLRVLAKPRRARAGAGNVTHAGAAH